MWGTEVWTRCGREGVFPYTISYTAEEQEKINRINTNMQDYAHPMIVNFIMGRTELTEDAFHAYQQKLHDLGLDEYLSLRQGAYERYTSRSE